MAIVSHGYQYSLIQNASVVDIDVKQPIDENFTFRFPPRAFEVIFDHLEGNIGKRRILDLCPSPSIIQSLIDTNVVLYSTVNFYGQVVNKHQSVEPEAEEQPHTNGFDNLDRKMIKKILAPILDEHTFDLILVWDIFNYMSRRNIIDLMAIVSPMCSPGAFLYLFNWMRKEMPNVPGKFDFLEDGDLEYATNTSEIKLSPTYSPLSFKDMMPSFRLHRTLANRAGFYEILLQFHQLAEAPDPNLITHFSR